MAEEKFSKLPELVKTSRYEIQLAPCLRSSTFKGSEKIYLDVSLNLNILIPFL